MSLLYVFHLLSPYNKCMKFHLNAFVLLRYNAPVSLFLPAGLSVLLYQSLCNYKNLFDIQPNTQSDSKCPIFIMFTGEETKMNLPQVSLFSWDGNLSKLAGQSVTFHSPQTNLLTFCDEI